MGQDVNVKEVQFSDEIKDKVKMAFNNLKQKEIALIENLKKDEFYIKKGGEAFKKLLQITKNDAERVLKNFTDFKKNKEEEIYDKFIEKYPNDKDVLDTIYTFVAYCDVKASKKDKFNEYKDKRVMAAAGIYQNAWIPNLLKFLIGKRSTKLENFQIAEISSEVSPGVKNAIKYFCNHEKFLPIISETHKKLISKYFFGKKNSECDEELIQYFNDCLQNELDDIKNQANKNYLYNKIIYARKEEWESKQFIEDTQKLLEKCKNIILTGAPGTGKTFLARENITKLICGEKDFEKYYKFVQFHPTYDYTDFVEGLRPENQNGNIVFERKDGIFKRFCKCAILGLSVNDTDENIKEKEKEYLKNKEEYLKKHNEQKYLFIIDEINRGDISKIFGELFFAIDPGYRGEIGRVDTQYQNLVFKEDDDIFREGFYIPDNVYIIGTMNDIDRSVESLDFAFRRRFAFKEISVEDTQYSILLSIVDVSINIYELELKMNAINNLLKSKDFGLSEAYCIGAAYFTKIKNYSKQPKNKFESLWDSHLKGVLYEYFRGEADTEDKLTKLKGAYDNA